MWEYLEKLTTNEGKTIIITTHYIEEAKHCNTVSKFKICPKYTMKLPL
jgi:ABC-type multidrug transport system ATPase subunit